jgi:hypothetical protein
MGTGGSIAGLKKSSHFILISSLRMRGRNTSTPPYAFTMYTGAVFVKKSYGIKLRQDSPISSDFFPAKV